MDEISITISIADRPYRLTIKREEEERVRKAAAVIYDRIKDYAQNYAYKDRQDLLAMVALQFATSSLLFESEVTFRDNHLTDKLVEIDQLLSTHLTT
ncbi:MAG: cell division protein ZapA [Bacteroidetes bacterium HGW-Bacteroidetes-1]|jgi:cell division protein ZapA|nr:MAG: cell division protein ZapA [Bacteroidetes bacterium HGW-Bacteroidetes-1]